MNFPVTPELPKSVMKKELNFVNAVTFSNATVRVGPDHLLILVGIIAAAARAYSFMSDEDKPLEWLVSGIVLVHLPLWRHLLTLPVIGSMILALMSSGMSMMISGLVINKMIAQQYRDAGWKIRQVDGELGEYSSRFLAMHEYGFEENDLMAAIMPLPPLADWPDDDDPSVPDWRRDLPPR